MHRTCIPFLVIFLLPISLATAQITVGPNVQVSRVNETREHDEVMMGADPTDASRLVACSHMQPARGSKQGIHTVAYVSQDGGRLWRLAVDDSATPGLGFWTRQSWDPTCTFGENGTVYVGMGMRINHDGRDARVRLHRSFDGGNTWQKPILIDGDFDDKPILTVDTRARSPYRGRVYLAYIGRDSTRDSLRRLGLPLKTRRHALSVQSSTTRGERFDAVVPVYTSDSLSYKWSPGPFGGVVLSDGTLVLLVNGPEPVAAVSSDGGRTFAVRRVGPSSASGEGGGTMGLSIATDVSEGPFHDRVYVGWAKKIEGRDQIVVSYSKDRGLTWSPPRVVSDDQPRVSGKGPDHMLTAIAVNREGVVGLSWYDRREHTDNLGWYTRFSASLDGGESWLPSLRVSEQPNVTVNVMQDSRPRPFSSMYFKGNLSGSVSANSPGSGHFAGMAASADGSFHPLWVDNRTGVSQVWTATVRVQGKAVVHGDPALSAYRDVSDQVTIHLYSMRFTRTSATTATVEGDLYVENTSPNPLRGPLIARFHRLTAPAATVALAGARPGVAAVLDLTPVLRSGQGVLVPGAHAGPLRIRFELKDIRSTDPQSEDLQIQLDGVVLAGPGKR